MMTSATVCSPTSRARRASAGVALLPDSGLGLRKYSEMAARSGLLVAAISHSTRKKAIIAVTKSA